MRDCALALLVVSKKGLSRKVPDRPSCFEVVDLLCAEASSSQPEVLLFL